MDASYGSYRSNHQEQGVWSNFRDAGAFGRLQGFCRKTGGFEHDPHESARKRVRYRHGMVRRYYHDRNKRKVVPPSRTRSEDAYDWVPTLATKLVGFVQTLLNRPYTKRDLKKADHTYSPQEEGGRPRRRRSKK